MKLLILAVLCFGVNANKDQTTNYAGFRPGLASLCKKFPIEVEKCCSIIIERDEKCTQIGNCLIDNEGAVNNNKNFVYPCVDNDIECVRKVFGEKCLCHPVDGPVKDPFCLKQYRSFIPSANVTVIITDEEVWGLNDVSVHSFYLNTKTGWLVLTIEVPTMTLTSPKVCIEFHRIGKQSIIRCDRGTSTYNPIFYTFEFPGLPECRMNLGRIHAYVPDLPILSLGPNIFKSNDPAVVGLSSALMKIFPNIVLERILFRSELIGAYFIQKHICNFDVKMCYV